MQFIQPNVEILEQEPTLEGALKMAEYAGRVCYQSNDIEHKTSTKEFVDMLIKAGHGEPIEHATIYLKWNLVDEDYAHNRYDNYRHNKYSVLKTYEDDPNAYVTTNYRVLLENNWLDDLKFICEPVKGKHEPRITVKFTTQNVIAKEANRHDSNSKSELSTRYCNFSKDRFGNEINISIPIDNDVNEQTIREYEEKIAKHPEIRLRPFRAFMGEYQPNIFFEAIDFWYAANLFCEHCYMRLIKDFGWTAQRARRILPLDVNTEVVHTAFLSDWKHFIDLRSEGTTGAPHPDMKPLGDRLRELLTEKGYLD